MLLSLLCCNYPSAVAAALPLLNFSSGSAATNKGPSIYDVHTEGEGSGSGGRMWTGGGGQAK